MKGLLILKYRKSNAIFSFSLPLEKTETNINKRMNHTAQHFPKKSDARTVDEIKMESLRTS